MSLPQKGFTLIELLIVVSIIAILAAIALPNFLEAQVRAKVSRAKADQRSLATALEAYAVDYSRYPEYFDAVADGSLPNSLYQRLKFVTTPVAYITSIPDDPFNGGVNTGGHPEYLGETCLTYGDRKASQEYWFAWNPELRIGKQTGTRPNNTTAYVIVSYGPTRDPWAAQPGRPNGTFSVPYDPTNGTMSVGTIYRMGPEAYLN